LLSALRDQIRLPITTILLGGAGLSLVLGEALDAAIIAATIGLNVAVGVWQERQVDRSADALKKLSTTKARLLRDGRLTLALASEVVPGDILVLAPGDRVCADARLFSASGLEVDEASLTGESLPVRKSAANGTDASRVVLDGSDVLVGSGRAVVVAVGRLTRMGTTAAALTGDEAEQSPLGARLSQVFRLALPLAVAGGAVTLVSGAWRGLSLRSQLSISVTTALTVLPEGLPLLAGTGQAGVARRLARRKVLVRRLAGVESLGRVDVACTDKTGTLTEGRPAVRLLADMELGALLPEEAVGPGSPLREVLLTAALASPHPDAADARAHPTDIAVVHAAERIGLGSELRAPRSAEAPFDPARYFHASVAGSRLCLKGAPEALLPRCSRQRLGQADRPLDETEREAWLARARSLADRGLRLLFVAQGPPDVRPEDPQGLVALGFVGIMDPLRASVKQAVRRCHEAGVHVLMLTGDHPATARAIAGEAGLLNRERDDVLTAAELVELPNAELDRKVARAAVVARATPLDKLRVIESLRRLGHTVAMTGDGVNDAPALRLADVGVAMGRSGTEVARQAADVVLEDDDFATLVEALVEGRGFWQNMRRGISLLVGGNLGELGLIVGSSLLGAGSPLSSRQILIVNLITDALPALAVVLQQPAHRNLAGLAREGVSALDASLRKDVLRRATATGASALGAYLLSRRSASLSEAGSVAFASIVATQLAQTLDAGRIEGTLSLTVAGAVAASAGVLGATILVPPVRRLLGLAVPGPFGWILVGTAAAASVVLSRCLATGEWTAAPVLVPKDKGI
jgi:cation-transporting ATPase I